MTVTLGSAQLVLSVVLLLCHGLCVDSQSETSNHWINYVDEIVSLCTANSQIRTQSLFGMLKYSIYCETAQRRYLQCIDKWEAAFNLQQWPSINSKPCGYISRSENQAQLTVWIIHTHVLLNLNLTFLEFSLPMPYGQCDSWGAPEYLLLESKHNMDQKMYLCGRRSPFSLIWYDSELTVIHQASVHNLGFFLLHYQDCSVDAQLHQYPEVICARSTAFWLLQTSLCHVHWLPSNRDLFSTRFIL